MDHSGRGGSFHSLELNSRYQGIIEVIQSELKKRNIAVIVYLVGIASIIVRNKVFGVTEDDWLSNIFMFSTAGALIAACWFYLKAKRRTGAWLLLLPLHGIALIIFWMLKDCSVRPEDPPLPKC